MSERAERFYVGVDVGTGSVRAALVTPTGEVVKTAVQDIQTWSYDTVYYEQSTEDIWGAVCTVVKEVISETDKNNIKGIGFDATCSLAIIGAEGESLTVSKQEDAPPNQNVILWMDHRAQEETDKINASGHPLLEYVGGKVSIEMELPKLLWLKKNIPDSFNSLKYAFDLPDFLTYKATNNTSRSLCSATCKWNYDGEAGRWNQEFLRTIGLEELACKLDRIGKNVKPPGEPVGNGISDAAAEELGLNPGTMVATSMIDAHAGALGMYGTRAGVLDVGGCPCVKSSMESKLAIIAGTSTCHMSVSKSPIKAKGVWGPYKDALFPSYYLNEGGQTATGKLLVHILETHPAYAALKDEHGDDISIFKHLNETLVKIADEKNVDQVALLTKDIHVTPDLHGNRSPLADPSLRGMVVGRELADNETNLAIMYLAYVQSLAYGTRHIIETLIENGRKPVEIMLFCGGLAKNNLYVQTHADACNINAMIPDEPEMVLVGAAMLGACASGQYPTLEDASRAMGGTGQMMKPNKEVICYHNRKYQVFLDMIQDQYKYKKVMAVKQRH